MDDETNPRENPNYDQLKKVNDHDLLIIMHTQLLQVKADVKDMRGNFAGKWVERFTATVILLTITGIIGGAVTIVTNAASRAFALWGGH